MNLLNLSENILNLRRKRKITQEELADFIGVTKASVSKWETKQSLPDILLLPQLASFFDVTVDELLGYEPQLSKEQIQKYYLEFATLFAKDPFEEVMKKTEVMIKQYYSCYSFLLQMCILWMNHYMLAEDQERQIEILNNAIQLCQHIISDCQDAGIRNDAIMLKAGLDLQCGRSEEVIEILEDMFNPYHLSHQSESVLINAYQRKGDMEKANQFTQFSIYLHLSELISLSIQYLNIHLNDLTICQETIERIEQVIDVYQLDYLDRNLSAQFHFQVAVVYISNQKKTEALVHLQKFAILACQLLTDDNLMLHGDHYFDLLHKYFEESDLGVNPVKDKRLILNSAISALDIPLFSDLVESKEFQEIKKILIQKGESL